MFWAALVWWGVSGLPATATAGTSPPNLIVILTDDLSSDLLAAMRSQGLAPNIDQSLAGGGVTFENSFVTNALCCPSRVTLLRGQYSHGHGVFHNRRTGVAAGDLPGIAWEGWLPNGADPGREGSTLPVWLQSAGYRTGHVGRYLNGYGICGPDGVCVFGGEVPPGAADPKLHVPAGYDDWHGLVDPSTFQVYDYELNHNGVLLAFGDADADYQTDVLADRAAGFIDDSVALGSPFFLAVDTFAPHVELFGGPKATTRFELSIRPAPRHAHWIDGDVSNGELPAPVPKPSFNEQNISDKPSCLPAGAPPEEGNYLCPGDLPKMTIPDDATNMIFQYKSMMASMMAVDDLVGTLMERLEAHAIVDETVVVFTSDNGWMYGEHRASGKEVAYEEAIRVPLLIRGPGFAQDATASQTVLNNDLAPTLAALAGVVPPYAPDGTSLVPVLQDPAGAAWHRKRFLVEHWYVPDRGFAKYAALRYTDVGRNLLFSSTYADLGNPEVVTHSELYDLAIDPYQMQSLQPSASVLSQLRQIIALLRKCSGLQCRALEAAVLP